jgi:acetoin utilization protein AcuC
VDGTARHGASIAGGQHHAMRASASGFCVYNDSAIAITWLLLAGAERIAYVDVDVHHADAVQAAFYDDPRVLTISLHEHPATLWPGTGLPSETGGPAAEGSAVNVALPAGTGDAGWLRAFDAVVPPLLRVFRPQILVSQHGCDTHWLDPLAGLRLSIDAQRVAHVAIHQLAHEVAGGRWLLTGEAAMSCSRWCRGPGRICWRRQPGARSTPVRASLPPGASTRSAARAGRHRR